jgi:hypothetical protein
MWMKPKMMARLATEADESMRWWWLTRVFWSVVLVTQATAREEDEQQCCHSKADA